MNFEPIAFMVYYCFSYFN